MNDHNEGTSASDYSWKTVFFNISLALVFSWLQLTMKGSLDKIIVINEFIGSIIGHFSAALIPALVITGFFSLAMPKTFRVRRCFVIVIWSFLIVTLTGIFL